MRTVWPILVLGLTGCDVFGTAYDSGERSVALPTADWQAEEGTWEALSHPCVGNRTDAMWWDSRTDVWVGCGSTVPGTGFFGSTDGGTTWNEVAPLFANFRVSSIQRASDGWLYVAGIDTESATRVVRVKDADIEIVWEAGNQVWNTFHVGTFRRSPQGVVVAESLTGTHLVVRTDDDADFEDGSGWSTDGTGYQILDMVVHGNQFYGAGSTISTPPMAFVGVSTKPLELQPIQLADWNGEMWSVDADGTGMVVGGINQRDNEGMVFVSGADPTDAGAWRSLNVSELTGVATTWIRGVCRNDALIVAVGENPMSARPILVASADNGASWHDWTDSLAGDPGALHRCELWDDGRLAVAGQSGYLAVWTP